MVRESDDSNSLSQLYIATLKIYQFNLIANIWRFQNPVTTVIR